MLDRIDHEIYGFTLADEYRWYQANEMKRLEKAMETKRVFFIAPVQSVNIFYAEISRYDVSKTTYILCEYRGINCSYSAFPTSLFELFCYMQHIAPLHKWTTQ